MAPAASCVLMLDDIPNPSTGDTQNEATPMMRRRSLRLAWLPSGSALLAQPKAVASDGDDVAVVQQAVQDSGRHYGVAEHRSPIRPPTTAIRMWRSLSCRAANQQTSPLGLFLPMHGSVLRGVPMLSLVLLIVGHGLSH